MAALSTATWRVHDSHARRNSVARACCSANCRPSRALIRSSAAACHARNTRTACFISRSARDDATTRRFNTLRERGQQQHHNRSNVVQNALPCPCHWDAMYSHAYGACPKLQYRPRASASASAMESNHRDAPGQDAHAPGVECATAKAHAPHCRRGSLLSGTISLHDSVLAHP